MKWIKYSPFKLLSPGTYMIAHEQSDGEYVWDKATWDGKTWRDTRLYALVSPDYYMAVTPPKPK